MRKPRILICEDEQQAQSIIKSILSRNEYQVEVANDGKESVEKTKRICPDLILLDIRMPKINGLEVAQEIRKFNDKVKIIFITGFQSPQLFKEATKYDITDYFVKPLYPPTLLKAVEEALDL